MALQIARAASHGTVPTGMQAGMVCIATFKHVFNATLATTDKLELGVLPANAKPLRATVIGVGMGAITADVGLMSGSALEEDAARTVGTDFFNDQSVNDTHGDAGPEVCLAIAKSAADRGIGVTVSGNVTASAAKSIELILEYVY